MPGLWAQVLAQRGHRFGWAPVLLAIGVAAYFAMNEESAFGLCAALLTCACFVVLFQRIVPDSFRIWVLALALVMGGFGLAGVRANMVAEPVWGFAIMVPERGALLRLTDRRRMLCA